MYFNELPPALAPGDELRPVPAAMVDRPLSTAEIAEPAVHASAALAAFDGSGEARRRQGRSGGKKKVCVVAVRGEDQRIGG